MTEIQCVFSTHPCNESTTYNESEISKGLVGLIVLYNAKKCSSKGN